MQVDVTLDTEYDGSFHIGTVEVPAWLLADTRMQVEPEKFINKFIEETYNEWKQEYPMPDTESEFIDYLCEQYDFEHVKRPEHINVTIDAG